MADKNPFPGENNTGHIWDDNIRELTNPPPRWWMIAFIASFLFVVGYSILYPTWPGITGFTKGILGWTSIEEYKEGMEEVDAIRAEYEERLVDLNAKEIVGDADLLNYTMASAKVPFGDHCAACHGRGGQGNVGFPVLADDDWLYGGTLQKIQQSITLGRKGIMIAHGATLSRDEIDRLAHYVTGLSEGKKIDDDPDGKALFLQKGCIGCHGMDAKGVQIMGSANLTDPIWRFMPGGFESARYTIDHGVNDPNNDSHTRDAEMPAFKDRLGEVTIKKLTVFVHQLGGGE